MVGPETEMNTGLFEVFLVSMVEFPRPTRVVVQTKVENSDNILTESESSVAVALPSPWRQHWL